MGTLDNDTTNLILKQLPALERLKLNNKVFKNHKPNQFQVSSELIASKELRGGYKGLIMHFMSTPDQYFTNGIFSNRSLYYNNDNQNDEYSDDYHDEHHYYNEFKHITDLIAEQLKSGNQELCIQTIELIQNQLGLDPWTSRILDGYEDEDDWQVKMLRREHEWTLRRIRELQGGGGGKLWLHYQFTSAHYYHYPAPACELVNVKDKKFTHAGLVITEDFILLIWNILLNYTNPQTYDQDYWDYISENGEGSDYGEDIDYYGVYGSDSGSDYGD